MCAECDAPQRLRSDSTLERQTLISNNVEQNISSPSRMGPKGFRFFVKGREREKLSFITVC